MDNLIAQLTAAGYTVAVRPIFGTMLISASFPLLTVNPHCTRDQLLDCIRAAVGKGWLTIQ